MKCEVCVNLGRPIFGLWCLWVVSVKWDFCYYFFWKLDRVPGQDQKKDVSGVSVSVSLWISLSMRMFCVFVCWRCVCKCSGCDDLMMLLLWDVAVLDVAKRWICVLLNIVFVKWLVELGCIWWVCGLGAETGVGVCWFFGGYWVFGRLGRSMFFG